MRYRTIGTDPATRREVSVLSLGAMVMGTLTDEATSFAILDRYVEAGGTFIDHLLGCLRAEPALVPVACSPLCWPAATSARTWPPGPDFDHPGTRARQAALRAVAEETGATGNQVVLARLIGGEIPFAPLVGASSVAQLDESLAAVDLELTAEQRAALDAAH
ncbi:aldo/keto reductase [Streptomyces sp. NPDC058240]|uniref:aldo/keto reductase n=1 Tax=Streptomyces sp. NPDC058240 TaxID=3346396 RepID=UPI0036E5127B